jgi:hypothetical protein
LKDGFNFFSARAVTPEIDRLSHSQIGTLHVILISKAQLRLFCSLAR